MSTLFAQPQFFTAAAADIQSIGSTVAEATAAAAAPTSGVLAAAADEVSTAIANLFGAHGQAFQAVSSQIEAFQSEFQLNLSAAANAYVQTEVGVAAALQGALAAPAAAATAASVPFNALDVVVYIGPTGVPIPPPEYAIAANNLYIRTVTALTDILYTPEELYPITGVRSLTLNQSVVEGIQILDNYVQGQLGLGNSVTVFGYSQSAIIASLYMQQLAAMGNPIPVGDLNFVLVGNEMNPNGGLLSRFPNLTLPTLGLSFYGATPSNTPYEVAIYTQEYDGFADFPRYPLNFVSDLNAVLGIATVHTKYLSLTPTQINNAIQLQTSPGYTGNTSYYMIETEELPLLAPVRALPFIGKPLAALIEPSLEVIVNLGYGDPYHGYSTSYADVQTTFGLFPEVAPSTLVEAFSGAGTQGVHDFNTELAALSAHPTRDLPVFATPTAADVVTKLSALPGPEKIVNAVATIASTDYATLLPLTDTLVAFGTTLPLYNAQLFVSQLAQGNLINALGYPIAADVGLATVAGIVQFLVFSKAIEQNIQVIQSLIP